MPEVPAGITSPDPIPGQQPYDATDRGVIGGGWEKIDGQKDQIDDIPGAADGPGGWKQT
jgi:hypothetical protein